jgi:hypothetical protein
MSTDNHSYSQVNSMSAAAKSDEPFSLTKTFGKAASWLALGAVAELIFLVVWHVNTGGVDLVSTLAPHINGFLNATGLTDAMHWAATMLGGGPVNAAAAVGGQIVQDAAAGSVFMPSYVG